MSQFSTEPRFHEGPDAAISAVVRSAKEEAEFETVVVISRSSGQPPIDAAEVDAELTDRRGRAMPLVDRPKGALPEGGGQGASVNALFRFRSLGEPPANLKVTYRGEMYAFGVREVA